MRSGFPGFYRPTKEEFDRLWNEGWFVLDANVLLNLYRYQEKARGDFIGVLEKLAPRIWVPHQAVLEYQRNRVKTIREQLQKFRDVRKLVSLTTLKNNLSQYNNRMRSLIDPTQFLDSVTGPYEAFEKHIGEIEDQQIKVESDESNDPVRAFLDKLLPDKVGPAFTQAELDGLHEEGEARYRRQTPPGYVDPAKKGMYEYEWAGCTHKRQFGDWILWKQVLRWAREKKVENVILVTDDRTEDWWEITRDEDEPAKTFGPRPELAAEIWAEAGVNLFYMYQPDRFLEWARRQLKLDVATSSIDEVRDVREREALRGANIEFTERFGKDFDHNAFQFMVIVNGEERWCVVAQELVRDFFSLGSRATSDDVWEAFRLNERLIRVAASEAIENVNIGRDGRFIIGIRELHEALVHEQMPGRTTPRMTFPRLPELDVFCQDCTCRKALTAIEHPVCSCGHRATRHN